MAHLPGSGLCRRASEARLSQFDSGDLPAAGRGRRYLDALDRIARAEKAGPRSRQPWDYRDLGYVRSRRTSDLATWHEMLLERLSGSEAEDRLDRLAWHPALGGSELTFVQARLAELRGDLKGARKLVPER